MGQLFIEFYESGILWNMVGDIYISNFTQLSVINLPQICTVKHNPMSIVCTKKKE